MFSEICTTQRNFSGIFRTLSRCKHKVQENLPGLMAFLFVTKTKILYTFKIKCLTSNLFFPKRFRYGFLYCFYMNKP